MFIPLLKLRNSPFSRFFFFFSCVFFLPDLFPFLLHLPFISWQLMTILNLIFRTFRIVITGGVLMINYCMVVQYEYVV